MLFALTPRNANEFQGVFAITTMCCYRIFDQNIAKKHVILTTAKFEMHRKSPECIRNYKTKGGYKRVSLTYPSGASSEVVRYVFSEIK